MSILFFDIEADGLLDTVTKAHCMVIKENGVSTKYRPNEVREGALRLSHALSLGNFICGHNIISYDTEALEKLYPEFRVLREQRKFCIDTLALVRLVFGDVKEQDAQLIKNGKLPASLFGKHKLKAWGYRIGELKGTFAEDSEAEDVWAEFSEEMLDYCEQDVVVTEKLYNLCMSKGYPEEAIKLEHEAMWLMAKQERNGFTFNEKKALELEAVLRGRWAVLDTQIRQFVPPIPDKVFIPKRANKKLGYVAGVPIQRYKDFNPKSRQQIEWIVTKHYNHRPDNADLYEGTRLKIDDETFAFIKDDEQAPAELRELAVYLEEYLMISKRIGMLVDGKGAWLKFLKEDGRIHGYVNSNGAVTGRATHSSPNTAQVPAVNSPYGKECRELFSCPKGWLQVGSDASGLELRCLGHFMYPYDNGKYAHTVIHGDIHTLNQQAAGLPTRNDAKTFIYAYLYGAGDAKIGRIVKGNAKDGKRLKKDFLKQTPALANLKRALNDSLIAEEHHGRVIRWKRKYIKGLDGRPLKVRSLHSVLNLLLQSAGGLICKKWIVLLEQRLIDLGLDHGDDFQYMAWVHDEVQIACRTREIAEIVARESQAAMRDTQEHFKFRVQLDTEAKIGVNWRECH